MTDKKPQAITEEMRQAILMTRQVLEVKTPTTDPITEAEHKAYQEGFDAGYRAASLLSDGDEPIISSHIYVD